MMAGEIAQKVDLIHHGDHGIQARNIVQAIATLIPKIEGGGHGQGFCDTRGLDHQLVKAAPGGQTVHLNQQVIAQDAADAAIGHAFASGESAQSGTVDQAADFLA